jgi:hypothetical protein
VSELSVLNQFVKEKDVCLFSSLFFQPAFVRISAFTKNTKTKAKFTRTFIFIVKQFSSGKKKYMTELNHS